MKNYDSEEHLRQEVFACAEWLERAYLFADDDGYSKIEEEIYDITIRASLDGEYRSALLLIASGGPNIYFDTGKSELIGYWGCSTFIWLVSSAIADFLDKRIRSLWQLNR